MQTLPAGSFLTLENDPSVEALKFTARLLAEHTEKLVREQLNAASLENLANNLWQKAEYVTRETERRRLQQIFVENFTERFRELKPDFDALTARIADSFNQIVAPQKVEVESKQTGSIEETSPARQSSEAQAPEDEFLGLVNSGERFGETAAEETAAEETKAATAAPQKIKQAVAESEAFTNTGAVVTEKESGAFQVTVTESNDVSQKAAAAAETVKEEVTTGKPQAAAQNDSRNAARVKSGTTVSEDKEPFEFGKCTVNLNLVLLPCRGSETSRKAIISTASHALCPEIEYLEIEMGEDLEQIAGLVKDKLSRFRASLPVKYIEQLRASKAKTAKTNQTAKPSLPAPPTAKSAGDGEKTSGEQKTQSGANSQSEITVQTQTAEKTGETASIVAPPVAPNSDTQPSLF
jgi:hypothetical protein